MNDFRAIFVSSFWSKLFLGVLKNWLFLQLQEDRDDFIFVQNGAPPYFQLKDDGLKEVRKRIGLIVLGLPDLYPCDFYLWWCMEGNVFVTPTTAKSSRFESSEFNN